MNQEEVANQIGRSAIKFQVGGFRPEDSVTKSWFGKILVCKDGEQWPENNGEEMIPICQINLKELSDLPGNINDLDFLTLFVGPQNLPDNDPNGVNWLIRTYESIEELILINQPNVQFPIKPFQMKSEKVETDFPCWEDCPIEIPEEMEDGYYDLFPNVEGIKIGGWPSLVQSEIFWAPYNKHEAEPEYVFQINSVFKSNWQWGDSGVAYIGRGSKPGSKSIWTFEWQCY